MSGPRERVKPGGWAAFDRKQRDKQGVQPQNGVVDDPFPPLHAPPARVQLPNKNHNNNHERSFSSLLDSSNEKKHVSGFRKLKELHCWAEDCLLEDIMAAAENDVDKASILLESMAPATTSTTSSSSDKKETSELMEEDDSCGKQVSDDGEQMKQIIERFKCLPVEPEWVDEDDVYLRHRKDALKTMRSASQHSKAASNAFLRGDHYSAQQHSLKAQEEWLAAQRLNSKAAKDILSIRNSKHDVWKLDLHGLHAAEAIQVLQEHLRLIETRDSSNRSLSPKRENMESRMARSSSLESLSLLEEPESLSKQQPSLRQRRTSLQVITGVGNHSRGQASLPTAVRGFLNENGYRFEELRPGVITIRPKFRQV
ncbi:hypothetical protein UlMin_013635 [Ulmus minor]